MLSRVGIDAVHRALKLGHCITPHAARSALLALVGVLAALSAVSCSSKTDEQLLNELTSDNPGVRLDAIAELLERKNEAAERPEVTDWLVAYAASLLDESAQWTDRDRARDFYDALGQTEDTLVVESLVRHLFKPSIRLRVLYLGMKLGIDGSEQKLVEVMDTHGDKEMAEDFLNSGSGALSSAAEAWAARHGYEVYTVSGGPRVSWGSF